MHARARTRGKTRSGRFLDQLLIAALDRAVSLSEMNHTAFSVAENLDFHVTATRDKALEINPRIAKGRARFRCGHVHRRRQILEPIDALHAATTAAPDGFDQQRRTNLAAQHHRLIHIFYCTTGSSGDACSLGLRASAQFVADRLNLGRRWADENHAFFFADSRERRSLRKEAVAGMNGVRLHA